MMLVVTQPSDAVPKLLPSISVRATSAGVVLVVEGVLDARACDLLAEVARAALVAVKRATRIHVDLTGAGVTEDGPPRVVRRLERAGASISWAPALGRRDSRSLVGRMR